MINEVRLLGRLARAPQLREFQNGGAACNLRVITSRSWLDPSTKEFREKIEGHNVVIQVANIARRAAQTLDKGSLVYIAGMLETRSYEGTDGVKRYVTEVVIRPFQGAFRRMPGNWNAPAKNGPAEKEAEIDYMAEMSGSDDFSFSGDDSDPFV